MWRALHGTTFVCIKSVVLGLHGLRKLPDEILVLDVSWETRYIWIQAFCSTQNWIWKFGVEHCVVGGGEWRPNFMLETSKLWNSHRKIWLLASTMWLALWKICLLMLQIPSTQICSWRQFKILMQDCRTWSWNLQSYRFSHHLLSPSFIGFILLPSVHSGFHLYESNLWTL